MKHSGQHPRTLTAASRTGVTQGEQLLMLPPTYLTCLEIGLHSSPQEVLGAAAEQGPVEMFMPEVEGSGDSASLSIQERLRALVEQRLT